MPGAERKAFAAEVGRISAKLQEVGQSANGRVGWLVKMAEITGIPVKTMQNWFTAFCKECGLSITPTKAIPEQQEDFFAWLEEQRAELLEKASIECNGPSVIGTTLSPGTISKPPAKRRN